jgi:VCBS repeat-containing protein
LTVPAPGVLANDSDPNDDPITAELVSDVSNGSLALNPDGSFTYTPSQDYYGLDSFTYLATDGELDSVEALVTITVNPVNDIPNVYAGDDVTIFEGDTFSGTASFTDPDPDTWTATVDYYSDGVDVWELPINPDKTMDLSNTYPADDGEYTVTVTVDDGTEVDSSSLVVTILNVAPSVSIDSIADGETSVLVSLDVDLVSSFSDPGDDTHSALIDWGDGTQTIDPAVSPLSASHAYQAAGEYTVSVTVTDDDGGVGVASTSITIVEPTEVTQDIIDELDTILTVPELNPDAADAIEDALVDLEGANDGQGNGGAIDKLDGGQWNAALVKIEKAIEDLEAAEAADSTLDLSEIKELLALTAKSVALDIIEQAQAVASTPADQQEIDDAIAFIVAGELSLESGDYLGAVGNFRDALGCALSVL